MINRGRSTHNRMSRLRARRVLLAALIATLAPLGGPSAASAAVPGSTLVVPGRSIGAVSLGMTRATVQRLYPLGRLTKTSVSAGRTSQTFGTISTTGPYMVVVYSGRSLLSRVVLASSGAGPWHTSSGLSYGDPVLEVVGKSGGCSRYAKRGDGSRDYDVDPGDGGQCEKMVSAGHWFYLSLNNGALDANVPAQLSGFTVSSKRLP